MATPRSRQAARLRARRRNAQHRARRLVALVIVAALALVTLLLTAFGTGAPSQRATSLSEPVPVAATGVPPEPEVLATVSNLQIRLPIAAEAVTAIGFHGAGGDAIDLQPAGRQANEGVLARLWRRIAGTPKGGPDWYQLGGRPGTEVLAVGAAPGTDVYAPVVGTVVAISDYVISGKAHGSRIDLRPGEAPSVIVSLTHLRPDRSLTVGAPVLATSKLGVVIDIAAVERQSLAQHARAAGNNVAIEVHPAAGSLP